VTRWGIGAGFALAIACGAERPPIEGSGGAGPVASGGNVFDTDAGTKPPGCGAAPDGSQCECLDVPLFVDPPTLYFVLDRSGSMRVDDKWTRVRVTIGKIVRGLGPRANFGAAMFPSGTSDNTCLAGDEIMSVRPGDPPSSGTDGPTTSTLLRSTIVRPNGGTPTGPTLEVVRSRLANVQGRTYVILATDGAPNCNASAGCGYDQCQPNIEDMQGCPKEGPGNCCEPPNGYPENCNDRSSTLAAISSLKTAGIPTFVLGLPGASSYGSLLDEMAVTGGTALPSSPKYFAVQASNEELMLAQLKKIAAQIAGTCNFDLKDEPAHPELVNVYVDDVVLPYEPVDGWTIQGKTVTLVGAACNHVKNGDALDVRIIAGCPRIQPR
jgi:hypothetical protein